MHDAAETKFESLFRSPLFRISFAGLVLCMLAFIYRAIAVVSSDTAPFGKTLLFRAMVSGLPFALLGFAFALGMFWILFRRIGASKVVVWLRRFHQHDPSRFPMPRYFTLMGTGWFQMATIQDTKFKTSFMTGATRSMLIAITIQVLLAVPFLVLSFYLTSRFVNFAAAARSGSMVPVVVATLLTPALQACAVVPIFYLLARRRGVVILKDSDDVLRATRWFARVRNGVGHFFPGLKIFKCGDAIWEEAVTRMLKNCDAVIIDITDLNKNICWELRQCMALVGAERVILAYGVAVDTYPADPDDILLDQIEAEIGSERLGKVLFWSYPQPLPIKDNKPVVDDEVEAKVLSTLAISLSHVLEGVPLAEAPQEDAEPDYGCGAQGARRPLKDRAEIGQSS